MPIVINLLAEEQAAEEQRRRDPVKKAILIAGGIAALFLVWGLLGFFRVSGVRGEMRAAQATYAELEPEEKAVIAAGEEIKALESRLEALDTLVTNRFLWGTTLDALQFCTVDGIRLFRLETRQTYALTPAVAPRPDINRLGKPAESKERIVVTIHATDYQDNYSKFIDAIAGHPYFKEALKDGGQVNLRERSRPQEERDGKTFRTIVIECEFPETVRQG